MKHFFIILIIALIFINGCTQPQSPPPQIFVCENGDQVTDPALCETVVPDPEPELEPEPVPEPEPTPEPIPEPVPDPEPEEDLINVDLNAQFRLRVNQIGFIEEENLKIKFLQVPEDSRCATDVVCITAGRATVLLNFSKNNQDLGDLLLTTDKNSVKEIDDFIVEMRSLDPLPISTQVTDPSNYLVALIVTKKPEPFVLEPLPDGVGSIIYNDLNFTGFEINTWKFIPVFPSDYEYLAHTEKINITMENSKAVLVRITENLEDVNSYMGKQKVQPFGYGFEKLYDFGVTTRINRDIEAETGWGDWIFFISNLDSPSLRTADLNIRFTYFLTESG